MKITILTTSFPEFRGDLAGNFVASLAQALSQRALLHIRVLAPHSPNTRKYERLEKVEVNRFQYLYPAAWQRVSYGDGIPANVRSSRLAQLGLVPYLVAFAGVVLRYRNVTDVYHAQWIVSGFVAVIARRIHRKPIVLTVRGSDLNLIRGNVLTALVRWIFTRVALITTVSDALRQKVLTFGITPDKVRTIPNGIDCHRFRPLPKTEMRDRLHLPADHQIVLWVGRLIPIKGLEFLLQAIPTILQAHPQTLFVLVGAGELEQELRAAVQQMGLSEAVRFPGKISSEEVPLWLNAADMLVLPSLNEGRPNVVLEAMACELPVVATRVGGIPELVEDGETGFLIPPKTVAPLSARINELLDNPSLRRQMAQAGRQKIFTMQLSWEQCAAQMQHIYQAVHAEP